MHKPIAMLAGIVAVIGLSTVAQAQDRKPTAKETALIRDCAKKFEDDVTEAERKCLFRVSDRCAKTPEGKSTVGSAECFRLEQAIWDELLNDNFKRLRDDLDDDQKTKLREMQRAWIAYRDTTCEFYYHKIQGTMAQPMTAACLARETARRALLLDFMTRL